MSEPACSRTQTSRRLTGLVLLAALSLTSGCATRESLDLPDLGGWETRQSLLGQLDEWAFNRR